MTRIDLERARIGFFSGIEIVDVQLFELTDRVPSLRIFAIVFSLFGAMLERLSPLAPRAIAPNDRGWPPALPNFPSPPASARARAADRDRKRRSRAQSDWPRVPRSDRRCARDGCARALAHNNV